MTTKKVHVTIDRDLSSVWRFWNESRHIKKWIAVDENWDSVFVENDVHTGGGFLFRISTKDGSLHKDIQGRYTCVFPDASLHFTLTDGRSVTVLFDAKNEKITDVAILFEEDTHHPAMEKSAWQARLDSFKRYAESKSI